MSGTSLSFSFIITSSSLHPQILHRPCRRHARQRLAVLQLFEGHFDSLLQLLVNAGLLLDGVVVDEDVRVNAVVLHNPLAGLGIVVGEEGHADVRTVHVGQGAADAHDAAPRAGTDDRAQLVGLEAPGEEVAIRSRVLVDKQHLRAILRGIGDGAGLGGDARHGHAIGLAE